VTEPASGNFGVDDIVRQQIDHFEVDSLFWDGRNNIACRAGFSVPFRKATAMGCFHTDGTIRRVNAGGKRVLP
jgi:hypothetical protein